MPALPPPAPRYRIKKTWDPDHSQWAYQAQRYHRSRIGWSLIWGDAWVDIGPFSSDQSAVRAFIELDRAHAINGGVVEYIPVD